MSTPFTNPFTSADPSWQGLLDEITLAYSERRQSLGQSAYTPIAGRDIQSAAYWSGIQSWIESNCVNFVDDDGPLNELEDGFLMLSLSTFREAAGLHANGFRRAVEWDGDTEPIWNYGQIQAGDIIGPWIFEDLQKAFSALKWSAKTPYQESAYDTFQVKSSLTDNYTHATCDAALSELNDRWGTAAWEDSGYLPTPTYRFVFGAWLFFFEDVRSKWVGRTSRKRAKIYTKYIPTMRPCSCDFYVLMGKEGGVFLDIDGIGCEEGKYFLVESQSASSSSSRETQLLGDIETNPVGVLGLSCPIITQVSYLGFLPTDPGGDWPYRPCILLKWNFTNQNPDLPPEEE